jgi:peptidoglycan/xylan/chitin deacetylase (PgdA/CDA1 family)
LAQGSAAVHYDSRRHMRNAEIRRSALRSDRGCDSSHCYNVSRLSSMRLVSPLLKHAVYPALHQIGWLDHTMPPGGYAVVNYHGVVPSDHSVAESLLDGNLVQQETFRRQLQFLKAHYDVISPDDFRAWIEHGKHLPPRAVLVTCDDGLLNTLTDMLPLLESEDILCLFFVTGASCSDRPGMLWYEELYHLMRAGPLDGPSLRLPREEGTEPSESFQVQWWSTVRRASRLDARARAEWMALVRSHCDGTQVLHSELPAALRSEKRWRLVNVTELKELADAGMTIGAHTLSHPVLSLCSEEEARHEILESKNDIERALGRPVWAFAYPFGDSSTMGEREVALAREAGFSCAFLNVEHWRAGPANPFALPRIHVSGNTTLPEFAAHLSGLHARLRLRVG